MEIGNRGQKNSLKKQKNEIKFFYLIFKKYSATSVIIKPAHNKKMLLGFKKLEIIIAIPINPSIYRKYSIVLPASSKASDSSADVTVTTTSFVFVFIFLIKSPSQSLI